MKILSLNINRFSKLCLIIALSLVCENVFSQNTIVSVLQTNVPQVSIQFPSTVLITNTLSVKPEEGTLELFRQAMRDHTLKDISLLIAGAFFAGLIGLATSFAIHKLEVKQRNKEELEFKENILRAIRSELESLSMLYEKGIGAKFEENKKLDFFPIRLSLTQEWFTVFNANAVHLGKIEKGISNRIVTTYALNKALIEAFRINNEYLNEMARVGFEIQQRGGLPDLNMRAETIHGWLVNQAIEIKQLDGALKESVKQLFAVLDERNVK